MELSTGLIRLQRIRNGKLADARTLRREMTKAERALWGRLRNRKLGGLKFRRQQIVEGFVTDFYCEKCKLAVEVDGGGNSDEKQKEIDRHRCMVFEARGVRTIRFPNESVLENPEEVLEQVFTECNKRAI
jgi:very-short-patch-repair endonuclease